MSKRVHIDCPDCRATGIYIGFAEQGGAGVICSTCKGTGGVMREFAEFTGRRVRKDILTVSYPSSKYVLVPGFDSGEITYEEFLAGKLPKRDCPIRQEIADEYNARKMNGDAS